VDFLLVPVPRKLEYSSPIRYRPKSTRIRQLVVVS